MGRRTRGAVVVLSVLLGLAGIEVGLNGLRGPQALLLIENLGPEPVGSLVVSLGDRRFPVAEIVPGGTARVSLSGRGPETLRLSFRQAGNAMTGFQHSGFDPAQMRRDGFKLVLRIRPNEVERAQEDAEPTSPIGKAVSDCWNWLLKKLGIEPDVSMP